MRQYFTLLACGTMGQRKLQHSLKKYRTGENASQWPFYGTKKPFCGRHGSMRPSHKLHRQCCLFRYSMINTWRMWFQESEWDLCPAVHTNSLFPFMHPQTSKITATYEFLMFIIPNSQRKTWQKMCFMSNHCREFLPNLTCLGSPAYNS